MMLESTTIADCEVFVTPDDIAYSSKGRKFVIVALCALDISFTSPMHHKSTVDVDRLTSNLAGP